MPTQTVVDVLSGFAAGVNVTLVGHPFETIKVRLQTQPSPPHQIYDGLVDCIRKTIAWEGPAGLYKGVAAPLGGQLFFRSAMFWCNGEYTRIASAGGTRPLSYVDYGLGGSVAWGVCTAIECPLQLASSQLQVQMVRAKAAEAAAAAAVAAGKPAPASYAPEFSGVVSYFTTAPARYGLRALYGGVVPHLCRNVPGGFFHFGAFEASRREYAKAIGKPVTEIGLTANMVAGSLGGVLFWLLTYPADVLKSALQGDSLNPAQRKYHGVVDAAQKLWADGGAKRFTRGLSACILRAVPANAVLLTTAFRVKELGYAYWGVGPAAQKK